MESGSEIHAKAALRLNGSLPISDFRLGSSMSMAILRW